MKVLFVTSETYPYMKTGGLADVAYALPGALRAIGVDARILMPGYPAVLDGLPGPKIVAALKDLPGQAGPARLFLGEAPNDVPVYAIDCPGLFARPGNPYTAPDGSDWPDNYRRFGALGRVGASFPGDWQPDVIHAHDWQAGLAIAYPALERPQDRPATVFTIHNLAFQGRCSPAFMGELRLPPHTYSVDGVECFGAVSFLKAGLFYADKITTVSPTYAAEIQTPMGGRGLDGLLFNRRHDLVGILNGVDTEVWDPESDPNVPVRYNAYNLGAKAANKAALRGELGLAETSGPLCVAVSRLSEQKGLDLVLGSLGTLLSRGGQLAVLGSGEWWLEDGFRGAEAANPQNVAVRLGYDELLAHRLQGGGDAILVPSRFEPCGLTQMYGLRYGTLPIVRHTGGLADTVQDWRTGFVFGAPTPLDMATAFHRACDAFYNPGHWHWMQQQAMAEDVSWKASAERYLALYRELRPNL